MGRVHLSELLEHVTGSAEGIGLGTLLIVVTLR